MGLFVSKVEDDRLITIIHSLENRIAILEGNEPPNPLPKKKLNSTLQQSIHNFKFNKEKKKKVKAVKPPVHRAPSLYDELSSAITKRRECIMEEDGLYKSTAEFILDGIPM